MIEAVAELEPDPIEIDPRPCEWCGLTIDRHTMADDGDGPEFFCADVSPDEMMLDELERRAELIRGEEVAAIIQRMEIADPRDRWLHTGEPRPEQSDIQTSTRPAYCTPQSVIDAFWHVVQLDDPDHLAQWLEQHPADAPHLHELWGRKCATAA